MLIERNDFMDNKLERLYEKKNEIINRINIISKKLFSTTSGTKEYSEISKDFRELKNRLFSIDKEIFFAKEPDNTNGFIDLRESEEGVYDIYLSGTREYVGFIEYNGYHVSRRNGDVGCKILSKYQRKGIAFDANVLLGDILYKKGIKDFWGSAIRENAASRNLMEKYGGVIIAEDEYPGVVLYECDTKPKEDLEKRRRK